MPNIQTLPGWSTHPGGPLIGGAAPSNAAWWAGPPVGPSAALLAVEGPVWATTEAFFRVPLIASDTVRLSLDVTIDALSLAFLGRIEFDRKRVKAGQMQNFSGQRILPSNMLQVSDVRGNWLDTGNIAPSFVPGVPLHHEFYYAQNPANGLYGTQTAVIGGTVLEVHPGLQGLAPQPTTWTPDGEYIQCQITIIAAGRAYILIDNLVIEGL